MLLIANAPGDDQPARFEPRKFALRCSRPGAGIPNQLGCIEASVRLTENDAEHTLLRLGEQRISQTVAARATRTRLHSQYGHHHALFGHGPSKASLVSLHRSSQM